MVRTTIGFCLVLTIAIGQSPAFAASPGEVEFLASEQTRAANRPFSDAVRVGKMIYLSGALGTLPGKSTLAPGGTAAETRQALENIKVMLAGYGTSMDRVVKCTVMLADIKDYGVMNEIYVSYFPGPKPARSTFAAKSRCTWCSRRRSAPRDLHLVWKAV